MLKTRPADDTFDPIGLERKHNIKLPPQYRLFAETFLLGKNCLRVETYCEAGTEDCSYLPNPKIGFEGFNTPEESILFAKEIENSDQIENLFIGHADIGGIAIGINGDRTDTVFLYDLPSYGNEYSLLANNIFEFVRELGEIENSELVSRLGRNRIYRNFGDNEWLVQ